MQRHLGGVIVGGLAVVVEADALLLADELKPVGHAGKGAEGLLHLGAAQAGFEPGRSGQQHVLAVVGAGHG